MLLLVRGLRVGYLVLKSILNGTTREVLSINSTGRYAHQHYCWLPWLAH